MPKAYAYVRWSTAEQGEAGRDSQKRQTSPLEAFTATTGVPVVETVIDKGVSAFRGANARLGQLKGLLDRIENEEIEKGDYIIVESIDRLTRQKLHDSVELIQSILKKGIRLHTVFDNKTYSYDDPSRDLETLILVGVIAKRAHEESDTKSKRLKSSWLNKRDEAETKIIRKQCPYGFRYDEEKKAFVIHEEEAQEIRNIFERLKYVGILEAIKKENETSKRKWSRKHIDELIKTKSPIGVLCLSRRKENGSGRIIDRYIPNYYPKIIEEIEFDAAITAVKSRFNEKKSGRRSLNNYNIFRHCIQCEEHKVGLLFNLQGIGQEKKRYAYLVCANRAERVCECENRIRFEYVFALLLEFIKLISKHRYIDENTIKEREKIKYTRESDYIEIDKANDVFNRFFSAPDTSKQKKEKYALESLLSAEKQTLEMLEASLSQYTEIIPKTFIKKIAESEAKISNLENEIQKIQGNILTKSENLEIKTYKDILRLYETEAGRFRLNSFFISRGIIFEISHITDKILKMRVNLKDDPAFGIVVGTYKNKIPLADFDLTDLASIIK